MPQLRIPGNDPPAGYTSDFRNSGDGAGPRATPAVPILGETDRGHALARIGIHGSVLFLKTFPKIASLSRVVKRKVKGLAKRFDAGRKNPLLRLRFS
ncbi:MAG: hypothetical protein CMN76_06095 [Spirochaetaceae bacterium]|nr:hypothetical protein [Spirochaetaceae bacterium]